MPRFHQVLRRQYQPRSRISCLVLFVILCNLVLFQFMVTRMYYMDSEEISSKVRGHTENVEEIRPTHSEVVTASRGPLIFSTDASKTTFKAVTRNDNYYNKFNTARRITVVWNKQYPQFELTRPNFANKYDEEFFDNVPTGKFAEMRTKFNDPERYRGRVILAENVVYPEDHDCGFKSNIDELLRGVPERDTKLKRNSRQDEWKPGTAMKLCSEKDETIALLLVPGMNLYQHLLDGALPKLMQALDILRSEPNLKLVIKGGSRFPFNPMNYEIYEKLGFSRDRIIRWENPTVESCKMYYLCLTPPIHPELWKRARRELGVPDTPEMPRHDVVLIARKSANGRQLTNEAEVIAFLRSRYSNDFVYFDHHHPGMNGLENAMRIFGKAKVVIGAHGGGLYNINFSPSGLHVIEFLPADRNKREYVFDGAGSGDMIWTQSVMLGHNYWHLVCQITTRANMNVDIAALTTALDAIDQSKQKTPTI